MQGAVLSPTGGTSHLAAMLLYDLYRAYFLHQCQHHPELLHEEDERIFGVIDIEESFGDFRQSVKEKSFVFRLINYTYQVGMPQHEELKYLQGGFLIVRYFNNRNQGHTDYTDAMAASERVMDEFVEKMISDSRAGHPLWYHSLDSRQDISVQPIYFASGQYCGYRVIFNWHTDFRVCLEHEDAPAWTDGGITPHDLS